MFGDRNNVLIEPPAPASPVAGLPGGHAPGEGEVHLLDRLSVIYRYRKVVLTVVLVVIVAGFVQTMTTTPEYRAEATVTISADRALPGLQTIDQAYVDMAEQLETEMQALRSRDLVRTTVGPLGLANNPEFNGQGVTPTGFGGAVAAVGARVIRPIRNLITGATEPPATATPEGAPVDGARTLEDQIVDAFLAKLTVAPRTGSRVLSISFVSHDPALAAAAANLLAQNYVDQNLLRKKGSLLEAVRVLNDEIKGVDGRIKQAESDMASFRQNNNASALADPTALATNELTLQARFNEAQDQARLAREAFNEIKDVAFDSQDIDKFPAMYSNAQVVDRKAQLTRLQNELSRMTQGEIHPARLAKQEEVKTAQEQLRQARSLVVEQLRLALVRAESAERVARENLAAVSEFRESLGTKGITYSALERLRDAQQETARSLQAQLADLNVQASAVQNNVWIQDRAVPPAFPFKPNWSRNLLIALFVGFALAGALAFGLDYLDDTIKTPEDITRKLRVPFLGLVPSVRGDKQPVLSGPVPHDFGEAYRALRTSLVFTSGGESTRIITCTSAQPLEGKTTTACNLAMVLAFGGSRVLLIDADMRRPGVHKALKINNTVGLSHLLVGQARVREAIQRTSDPNFCVMTAGRTPPNPSELLSSERMKQLIANLKQGPFDWVVIDTPPVLAVTDAVILTPLVDGVTFVLGAEMTRRRLAERAVQMLMVSRPRVVGAVLNRVNFDRNKYYYSRYYGYQYKSYYGSSANQSVQA